jgi:hypothetical protein
MSQARAYVIVPFALFVVAACSPATIPSTAITNDQACADSATARCQRYAACGVAVPELRYGDVPTCETRINRSCLAALTAANTGHTTATVEACANAIPTWSCEDFLNNENLPEPCWQKLGSTSPGGACQYPGQCQTGFCAIAPGQTCGVCRTQPALGDSCKALTTCGQGLTCTSDTTTCVFFGGVGDACGTGAICGAALICVGANTTTGELGTCQAAVGTLAAPCIPTPGGGPGCDRNAGLSCNSQSMQCAPAVIATPGQSCAFANNQQVYCASAASCTDPANGARLCASAEDGAKCDLVAGPPCVPPARCIVPSGNTGTVGFCQLDIASQCP